MMRSQVLRHALARWISEPPAAISPLASDARSGETAAQQLLDSAVIGDLDALGGDVLPGLLSLYFDDARSHLATIRDAAVRGEAAAIGQTAHMLKGSSGSVGAARVSQIAAELEVEARAGAVTRTDDLLDALARALDETREAFRHRSA